MSNKIYRFQFLPQYDFDAMGPNVYDLTYVEIRAMEDPNPDFYKNEVVGGPVKSGWNKMYFKELCVVPEASEI